MCGTRPSRRLTVFTVISLLLLDAGDILRLAPPAAAQTGLPTSRIAEGVYYIYATREGLVGGTTSSGYRIQENDFFVALPGCTPTNCPGGLGGYVTQCGTRCYVKVINPVTNRCRVEPIKDVGPWFTVDNWWAPSGSRFLNSRSSIPQQLPQGYTGSDAARDGLNVGYGISSTGIGYDNTVQYTGRLRPVGNRAAIDLADGTWRNLQLTSPDGVGSRVFVHMLWQTGEDPASVAAACGHPLNQRPGTGFPLPDPTATPYPYPPPTSTVIVTPAPPTSYAIVTGTGGLGLRCRTEPSTTATVIMTLPEGSKVTVRGLPVNGWQPVVCNGKDGWASAQYLVVTYATPTASPTPSPSPSPTITPTVTATSIASPIPDGATVTPTATATPTVTATVSPTPGVTPSPSPSPSPTATKIVVPSPTATTAPSPTVLSTMITWATVTGTGGLGLRCRSAPTTGAPIITTVPEGGRVPVTGAVTGGWYPVTCANRAGWMFGTYLKLSTAPATPTPTPTKTPTVTPTAIATTTPGSFGTAVVANADGSNVRCRTQPSLSATIITSLPEGTVVTLRGPQQGDWMPVRCANREGWMWAAYLQVNASLRSLPVTPSPTATATVEPTATQPPAATIAPTATQPPAPSATTAIEPTATLIPPTATQPPPTEIPVTGSAWIASASGDSINCRAAPSTEAAVIGVLAHGSEVATRGEPANGWQGVVCDGQYGYVAVDFIAFEPPPEPTAVPEEPEPVEELPAEESVEEEAPAGPFGGAPVGIADAWSEGGSGAWNAVDGGSGSAWESGSEGASLVLDLGGTRQLSGIRWQVLTSGTLRIERSWDAVSWEPIGSYWVDPIGWDPLDVGGTAAYIRFVVEPGTSLAIAEIEVWANGFAWSPLDTASASHPRLLWVADRGYHGRTRTQRRSMTHRIQGARFPCMPFRAGRSTALSVASRRRMPHRAEVPPYPRPMAP